MLECPKYSSSFGHRYVSIFKMLLKGTDRLCKIVKINSKEFFHNTAYSVYLPYIAGLNI